VRPTKKVLAIALVAVISAALIAAVELESNWRQSTPIPTPKFFLGVELAYGGFNEVASMVDKVKNYTNVFVIGTPDISKNLTALNASCNYIYRAGLYFIVLFTEPHMYDFSPQVWISDAKLYYGNRFLGVYWIDEPGGKQLDTKGGYFVNSSATTYSDAGSQYVGYVNDHLQIYLPVSPTLFTSDYGLYWFDYKAGYNTVFTQFGSNSTRQLDIALCRGAAKVQKRDWGVTVTWDYNETPYIESADQLYSDMTLAYNAGAKYEVIFDYPQNVTAYGILTEQDRKSVV
jgi:hypothetical protein